MVIHTVVNEYDLLYAQEREAAYAVKRPDESVHTDTAAYRELTRLPYIRKEIISNVSL